MFFPLSIIYAHIFSFPFIYFFFSTFSLFSACLSFINSYHSSIAFKLVYFSSSAQKFCSVRRNIDEEKGGREVENQKSSHRSEVMYVTWLPLGQAWHRVLERISRKFPPFCSPLSPPHHFFPQFFFPGASFLSPIDCKKTFFFRMDFSSLHLTRGIASSISLFPYIFFFQFLSIYFFSCHYFSSNEDCQVNLGIHGLWKISKLYSLFLLFIVNHEFEIKSMWMWLK